MHYHKELFVEKKTCKQLLEELVSCEFTRQGGNVVLTVPQKLIDEVIVAVQTGENDES